MYLCSAQRGFVEIARRGGVVSKTKIFKEEECMNQIPQGWEGGEQTKKSP